MALPLEPPIPPMLAQLARELPTDGFLFEPKWDGFRCLAFRSGDEVDLRSRHGRPLSRYFPELVEALLLLPRRAFVLDGEIVVGGEAGLDFPALLARIHPAVSRVERLRQETPASYIAFDVLALGRQDLCEKPFAERRRLLAGLLAEAAPPVVLTPITTEREIAEDWLERLAGAGIDGVVAKHESLPYRPGERAMVKVKRVRTAECVVAGFRWYVDRAVPASLLLGLYDEDGQLRHVGVSSSFTEAKRRELLELMKPYVVPLEGHPWEHGYLLGGGATGRLAGAAGRWTPEMELDWAPLRPELVCEVAYDQVDGDRFRHPARFVRWRPDREALSCTLDQLELPPVELQELLPAR
jgi:ATP-dependent DNA ligase